MSNSLKGFTLRNDELAYLVELHEQGNSWVQIASKVNAKFDLTKSADAYECIFRRAKKTIVREHVKKDKFKNHPHRDFTRDALGSILKVNKKDKKRFFITAVAAGAKVDKKVLDSVLSYCKIEKAELVLLPLRAHMRALEGQPSHYDPILKPLKDKAFVTEYKFNKYIKALELQINPQQTMPLTGLHRIRGRAETLLSETEEVKETLLSNSHKISLIIAHSKQMMEVLPTGNNSVPRMLHSTGCISNPSYQKSRVGIIANEDHVLGGIILEIKGSEFYIRQIQINQNNGTFIDLGNRYHPNGKVTQERAEAFIMGDIHPGFHSKEALTAWYEVWDILKPKKLFLHDFFDGRSISHHLMNKNISKYKNPLVFKTLKEEFKVCKDVLYQIIANSPKDCVTYAVASNHPEHLDRYLEEGRYIKDVPENFRLGHELVIESLNGDNPLKSKIDPENRMVWLNREDDHIVEGTQCGAHGDLGPNGSRGSSRSTEKIYSSAMVGHSHTPGIFHDVYTVGHSSAARHGYNAGPSSWLLCSGVIYKGGHKQLIISINGNWKL